jgi:hypothetical protein
MFGKENKFDEESSDNSDASSMDVPPPPPQQQPPQPIPPPPPPPVRISIPMPFDQVDEEASIGDIKEEKKNDRPNSFVPLTSPRNEEEEKVEVDEEVDEEQQDPTAYVIDQDPEQTEAAKGWGKKHYEYVVQEREKKKRGRLIAVAIFVGLCLLAGLGIGVGLESREENNVEVPSASAITDPPTAEPSIQATPGDDCTTWVEPSLPCYNNNHTFIQVSFEMCNALPEDYVGIYPFSDELNPEDLGNPTMWIWTCGRKDLDECTAGIFVYSIANLTLGGRLAEGIYQVHLSHRNPGGPYSSEVASRPFNVSREC